jgi:hypothetical protein
MEQKLKNGGFTHYETNTNLIVRYPLPMNLFIVRHENFILIGEVVVVEAILHHCQNKNVGHGVAIWRQDTLGARVCLQSLCPTICASSYDQTSRKECKAF